jgi:octaprenyl-diphosphate synthase
LSTIEQWATGDSDKREDAAGNKKFSSPRERFKAAYWPRYAAPVAECERRLALVAGEPGRLLGESCSLLLTAGGKRLRPLLVFLAARRGQEIGDELFAAAAAVELVHMATLVHDDILDGAELRRGLPTLAAKYGHRVSTAAGDYLFSSAFEILSAAGSPRAISLLTRASLDLSLGELAQMEQMGDFSLTPAAYTERCRLKTAGLFSASCMLGALLSGCSQETIAAMDEFGRQLGLAFQLADDILDFTGDAAVVGKLAGADLRDGTVTLPLVMALERDSALGELLGGSLTDSEIDDVCRRVEAAGALDEARRQARVHVAHAGEALAITAGELDTGPLALIAEMAADRKV